MKFNGQTINIPTSSNVASDLAIRLAAVNVGDPLPRQREAIRAAFAMALITDQNSRAQYLIETTDIPAPLLAAAKSTVAWMRQNADPALAAVWLGTYRAGVADPWA